MSGARILLRLTALALCVLLLAGTVASGAAASLQDGLPGTGTDGDPADAWNADGYPEDVSFLYCAGGELLEDGTEQRWWELGVVNADETRCAELLALFSSHCLVTFVPCSVNFRERGEILRAILSNGDAHILSGLLVSNSEQIYILVSGTSAAKYSALLTRQYGSVILVADESGGIAVDDGGADSDSSLLTGNWKLLLVIGAIAAFVAIFSIRYAKLKKSRLEP